MDLFTYIVASGIYIMVTDMALMIRKEMSFKDFHFFLLFVYFAIGGIVGYALQSYEAGFVLAVVASLVLW